MQARFAAGTFERIDEVLATNEDRTAFVRQALNREISRRKRAKHHEHKPNAPNQTKAPA